MQHRFIRESFRQKLVKLLQGQHESNCIVHDLKFSKDAWDRNKIKVGSNHISTWKMLIKFFWKGSMSQTMKSFVIFLLHSCFRNSGELWILSDNVGQVQTTWFTLFRWTIWFSRVIWFGTHSFSCWQNKADKKAFKRDVIRIGIDYRY